MVQTKKEGSNHEHPFENSEMHLSAKPVEIEDFIKEVLNIQKKWD